MLYDIFAHHVGHKLVTTKFTNGHVAVEVYCETCGKVVIQAEDGAEIGYVAPSGPVVSPPATPPSGSRYRLLASMSSYVVVVCALSKQHAQYLLCQPQYHPQYIGLCAAAVEEDEASEEFPPNCVESVFDRYDELVSSLDEDANAGVDQTQSLPLVQMSTTDGQLLISHDDVIKPVLPFFGVRKDVTIVVEESDPEASYWNPIRTYDHAIADIYEVSDLDAAFSEVETAIQDVLPL